MESGAKGRSASGASDGLEELLKKELAPELQLVRQLGRSSKATVYLAREPDLKRLVAVKVLSPKASQDERARARFEREAQAVASLSHSNIVAIHRVGRLSNGLPYIVMQFVKGRTIADRLAAEGQLEMDEARRILAEMASAVAAAHKKGIVHRDIRPANVLYEEDTGRTLLADFGIAAVMARGDTDAPSRLTKTGELIGDPAYMSPEQLMGGELNERSDIYALGLLGYELIAGRGPYDTTSKREMFAAHVRDKPRNLTELRHSVDRALADLLERCLAKEPQHRPNASDLYRRLSGPTGESLAADAAEAADSTDFLSTLKRRYIPQIMALYAAVGLAVLGIAADLVDRNILPDVAYELALVSVVTGLPAVVTGAWFHGRKGRQKFTTFEFWVFGGLALIWLAVSATILVNWL